MNYKKPTPYPADNHAIRVVFRILKDWIGLVLFYMVVMEMTLLIGGYSFNFNLLSPNQQACRKQIRECQSPYIQTGIATGPRCPVTCIQPVLVTLKDYHKHNFISRMIDRYYEGTL